MNGVSVVIGRIKARSELLVSGIGVGLLLCGVQSAYVMDVAGVDKATKFFAKVWSLISTVWKDALPVLVLVSVIGLAFAAQKLSDGDHHAKKKISGGLIGLGVIIFALPLAA